MRAVGGTRQAACLWEKALNLMPKLVEVQLENAEIRLANLSKLSLTACRQAIPDPPAPQGSCGVQCLASCV